MLSITKRTKGRLPRLPFQEMKDRVLGKKYDLSLVFAGNKLTQRLNIEYRKKDYIPNVLSFPLDSTSGEIFINPNQVRKEAPSWEVSERRYTGFLFIHGLLHLKGLAHGSKMESEEKKLIRKFLD